MQACPFFILCSCRKRNSLFILSLSFTQQDCEVRLERWKPRTKQARPTTRPMLLTLSLPPLRRACPNPPRPESRNALLLLLQKVILLGNSGVGKSNLIARFHNNDFCEDFESTVGVEFVTKRITVDGVPVKLQVQQ